ncbi:MAG: LPXTG cell wall anchor domain-containing protein [Desulfovibrionaceae bacterium]|nr:LPXTG cell wall anchor domain-containing protein [Desulfovibrionaceae bacterium]
MTSLIPSSYLPKTASFSPTALMMLGFAGLSSTAIFAFSRKTSDWRLKKALKALAHWAY